MLVVHRLFREQMLLARTSDRHLNDGVWHHVCATYDGTGFDDAVKLFIDGQQEHATIEHQSLPRVYAVTSEPHAAHHAWIGSAGPHAPASLGKPFSGRLQHPFMARAVISAAHVHRLAVLAGGKLAPAQLTRPWLQLPLAQPYPHCVVQCRQMGRCYGVLFRGSKCRIAVSGRWSPRTAPWMRTRMNPRGWKVSQRQSCIRLTDCGAGVAQVHSQDSQCKRCALLYRREPPRQAEYATRAEEECRRVRGRYRNVNTCRRQGCCTGNFWEHSWCMDLV